jgi:hypothetical protein
MNVYKQLTVNQVAQLLRDGKRWLWMMDDRTPRADQLYFLASCWICQNGGGSCTIHEVEEVLQLESSDEPNLKWYVQKLTSLLKRKMNERFLQTT